MRVMGIFRQLTQFARDRGPLTCLSIRTRGEQRQAETKRPHKRGCDWRSPEGDAGNRSGSPRFPSSNLDCKRYAAQHRTRCTRGGQPAFATFGSSHLSLCRRVVRLYSDYAAAGCSAAILTIINGMRTRRRSPDFNSIASTNTVSLPIMKGSVTTSNCAPYSLTCLSRLNPKCLSLSQTRHCSVVITKHPKFCQALMSSGDVLVCNLEPQNYTDDIRTAQ